MATLPGFSRPTSCRARSGHASALAALLALALASCGGGSDGDSPATSEAAGPVAVEITAPENGARVKAKERVGSRLVGRVAVEGKADVGASLIVQTSCEEAECRQSFTTDTSGEFRELVDVWSRKGSRNGYVIVGAAGSAPADRERVLVLLEPPKGSGTERADAKKQPDRGGSQQQLPESEPEAEATTAPAAPETAPAPAPAPATGGPGSLVMIGDSLAEGTEPFLAGMLDGWKVTTDARRSRPLAEGMQILDATQVPSGKVVLAFSLFTNDAPGNVGALESAVRKSVQRAGSGGCAVWATIVRPPLGGVSYDGVNARLNALGRELRGRLAIVQWADAVARNPGLVGSDGVHGTSAGYRTRAQLYANAAQSCRG
jgi:hypothetical protein